MQELDISYDNRTNSHTTLPKALARNETRYNHAYSHTNQQDALCKQKRSWVQLIHIHPMQHGNNNLQDRGAIQAQNSGVGATRAARRPIAHCKENDLGVQAIDWRQNMAVVVFDNSPLKI